LFIATENLPISAFEFLVLQVGNSTSQRWY